MLLAGLGADHRLLEPQRRAFPYLQTPAWIPPVRRESLGDYARRLAETIAWRRPVVLGGVSLGGMLAWEMAPHVRPDVVLLIASCRSRRGIRRVFRALGPILAIAPPALIQFSKVFAPLTSGHLGQGGPENRDLLVAMYQDSDARFMHWAARAILAWQPCDCPGQRLLQIHGSRDLLIPCRGVEADEVIEGGGHLINLTHAEQVNAMIARAVAEAVSRSNGSHPAGPLG